MKKLIAALMLTGVCAMTTAQTLTASYKNDIEVNPIIPFNLCADPTAVEYNGRLYVYGTNDQQEYETTKDASHNSYGKITQLVCMSTADLVNWTFHGTINVKAAASWIWTSWAPSIVSREEADGKTHFYMYFTNSAAGIGVITATSPLGPWHDPIGHALIDGNTPGRGEQSNIIDPGVCIDDDGIGWLTFGGGDPNRYGSKLMPGNARIVKLGKDMISLDGPIKEIPAPFHFEANELNYINGKYVFSYSGGWSCSNDDWNRYSGKGSYSCPSTCAILSMTTDDPMNGTWKYTGELLKNPGNFGYPWGNNHSHLQKFGDNYYMIYHTQQLERKMGLSGGYRGIAINRTTISASTGKIVAPSMTNNGPTLLISARPTAADGVVFEAENMANSAGVTVRRLGTTLTAVADIQTGDWTLVRGFSFPEGAQSLKVRVRGKGVMELRLGAKTNKAVATIPFDSNSWTDVTVDLDEPIQPGSVYTYLYFVFTEAGGLTQFDNYEFSTTTTPINDIIAEPASEETIYDLTGRKVEDVSQKGIYIVNGKKKLVKP